YVDHAFYVGQSNKAYFKKYGFKDTELTFAPHAIDNNRFSNNAGVHLLDLRKSLHISEHDIIILYAGKFEAVKNIDLLLSAFIKLNLPGTHLLLAGNGVQEKELKQKASPFKNVHFTDFKNQTEMPALYHAADIYCLPSYSESWGLSVNEAMACGKAILASNKVGCAADLVQQDQNGVVFGSGSLPDLCNKLGGLVNKGKPTLTEMGILSKKIIESWNFENIAIAIENKLLNEKI
ncbi:MAG: glycosyltransferase, partial [Sphingobacteriaceae bacterium]